MAARKRKSASPDKLPAVGDINAAVRAKQALLMALEGRSYPEIAAACGFKDRSGAYRACQRELAHYRAKDIELALALELARLDAYLSVYAPKAMAGDGWSLDRCLRIGERRHKLLGLEYGPRTHVDDRIAQYTVVEVPPEVWQGV